MCISTKHLVKTYDTNVELPPRGYQTLSEWRHLYYDITAHLGWTDVKGKLIWKKCLRIKHPNVSVILSLTWYWCKGPNTLYHSNDIYLIFFNLDFPFTLEVRWICHWMPRWKYCWHISRIYCIHSAYQSLFWMHKMMVNFRDTTSG